MTLKSERQDCIFPHTVKTMPRETTICHPNRDTRSAKSARLITVLLLLLSAATVLTTLIGGAGNFTGSQVFPALLSLLYIFLAYLVCCWKRGALPVTTWVAILTAIFAGVSIPGWFDRSSLEYSASNLPPGFVGATLIFLIPLQALLLIAAVRAFRQDWQVEVEIPTDQTA